MENRQNPFRTWMHAAFLILTLLIGACTIDLNGDGKDSPEPVAGPSEFVSAAPEGARNNLDGDNGEAPPTADTEDDGAGDEDAAREIEEADIIKIDGTLLYILNQYRGLFICDIGNPDNPRILGRLSISGEPVDMYIREGRAYVIVSSPQYLYYGVMETVGGSNNGIPTAGSRVVIVDVSNSASPATAGSVELDGRVTDSRIVGNILYVVSSEDYYFWDVVDGGDDGVVVSENGVADAAGPYKTPRENDTRGTFVASIDISNAQNAVEVDRENLEGASQYIHVTDSAIFVPSTQGYYYADQTTITYVDISDPAGAIRKRGDISIKGSVQDKFKMDYADGYFRVCAYEWNEGGGKSTLRVIDANDPDNMAVTGIVELGQGEQLFATRFDGDKAYMVTFEQVDPLWVIDLSNPQSPRIAGELEVPGWSTHIEPRGDRLIALGVNNENGWQVSVSLFNVADPAAPSLVDRVSFGEETGWSSSTAYDDVKALTIIDEMGLILLPYSTSSWDGNQSTYEDRLQLVDYSASDLTARGWVTQEGSVLRSRGVADRLFSISGRQIQVIDASNRDNPTVTATLGLMDNIIDFEPMSNGYGVRLVQDDAGISTLQAVPMSDPEYGNVAGEIALEQNESYSALFVAGNLVYVISSYWGGVYAEADGVAIRPDYYYEGASRVTVYDFTNVAAPVKRGRLEIEGSYANTPRPMIYDMIYPYYSQGEFHRLGQNTLVFIKAPRNYDYPIYGVDDADSGAADGTDGAEAPVLTSEDPAVGTDEPNLISENPAVGTDEPNLISENPGVNPEDPNLISEDPGVAPEDDDYTTALEDKNQITVQVVDLTNAAAPVVASKTVLHYAQASGYFVNNGTLYFSYYDELETDAQGRPQTRYFLGRLDLSDIRNPEELPGINIPGTCLGLNAAGVYGYTLNTEWTGSGETRQFTFNAIWLDGGNAYLQDTVNLGSTDNGWYYGYDYALSETRAYFSGFGSSANSNESLVKVIDLSAPQELSAYDHTLGTGGWLDLMDASGSKVFLRASDSVACYDTASPNAFTLDDYRSPGGWGNQVVFSGGKAYVPMGYYGLWVKDMN